MKKEEFGKGLINKCITDFLIPYEFLSEKLNIDNTTNTPKIMSIKNRYNVKDNFSCKLFSLFTVDLHLV